ncbi:hypothetical protein MMMDOFMJ_0497 [Methylobacterium gnaphalii]|nr:hypothetical protein MMMDOFMJ_0497 [Methylobacterium gnaphalii]
MLSRKPLLLTMAPRVADTAIARFWTGIVPPEPQGRRGSHSHSMTRAAAAVKHRPSVHDEPALRPQRCPILSS